MGFLSSVGYPNKLINPKKGMVGTSDFYSQSSTCNKAGLSLASQEDRGQASLVGLTLTCGV